MLQTICDFLSSGDKQVVIVEQFLTISLSVIGIAFTLLTVLQSFIESKKNSVQSWNKAIKNVQDKDKSPMIYEREQVLLANKYILRQKKLAKNLELLICLSAFLFVLNLYPKFDNIQSFWYYCFDLVIFIVYVICLLFLVMMYINLYEQNVNDRSLKDIFKNKFLGLCDAFRKIKQRNCK